jgi:hypothetical protein
VKYHRTLFRISTKTASRKTACQIISFIVLLCKVKKDAIMQTALEISDAVDNGGCVLLIQINGRMRQINTSWLVDSGRMAGSALAKQIL